jgi:hypothetical protein
MVSRRGGNVGNRIKGKVHANNDGRFGSVHFNDENGLWLGEVKFPEWMSKEQRKRIAREICAQFPLSMFAIQGLPDDHPKVIEFKKRFVDG